VGKDIPAKLTAIVPSYLVDKVLRNFVIPTFNLTVSNVRGPGVPLYMAGAKLVAFMPINMLLDGMGLSITGFSYNGILWVCMIADRGALPDPAFFARCFNDSFAEVLAAAGRQPAVGRTVKTDHNATIGRKAAIGNKPTTRGKRAARRKTAT
jgi:diacylglycerol O-acyltransferase